VKATWIAALALVLAPPLLSAAPRIKVRGTARIDAHAARDEGDLVLSGSLADDAGHPLPNEPVTLTLLREGAGHYAVALDGARGAKSCSAPSHDASDPRPSSGGGPVTLTTDEAGRFCVRVNVATDRYVAQIAWQGTPLVDGAHVELPVDTGRQALTLRFDPAPRVVSIDAAAVSLEAVATVDENGITRVVPSLPVVLANERGEELGYATTNTSGRGRFALDPSHAGPPGKGELRISFAGDPQIAPATHAAPIERRARVTLTVPTALTGILKEGAPEDGVTIVVRADSRRGAVAEGSVEASVGDSVVGAAQVERVGEASVVATFIASAVEAPIRLRYSPSSPWYEPGEELVVRLPVSGPSLWRNIPLLLAGLGVVAWLALGRTAKKKSAKHAEQDAKAVSHGEAKIDVVCPARSAKAGWVGRVVDAHEGTPVAGATIGIRRPNFGEVELVARTVANDAGRFELRFDDARPGDEMTAEAPLHALLRQPLPGFGELEIAIMLRKRKLLERLVRWARRRGRPFDAKPEPTPGHVRRAADDDFATARWADAIEHAAFAGAVVDGQLEAEINRLAPPVAGGADVPAVPPASSHALAALRQKGVSPKAKATLPAGSGLPQPPPTSGGERNEPQTLIGPMPTKTKR
jgi:hypothetical protein